MHTLPSFGCHSSRKVFEESKIDPLLKGGNVSVRWIGVGQSSTALSLHEAHVRG